MRIQARAFYVRRRAGLILDYCIGPNRKGDVLEVLITYICELKADLTSDVVVGSRRDADAAWLCNALKSRRNVYAVAKYVMRFDNHVTDIDADAERNPPVFRIGGCQFFNTGLELHSGSNRFDSARKLRQEPVAGVLDDAAAVLGDCGINGVRQKHGQFGVRSFLIIMHKPRIASHVCGQYRRQPALDPAWRLLRHSSRSLAWDTVRWIRQQCQMRFDG